MFPNYVINIVNKIKAINNPAVVNFLPYPFPSSYEWVLFKAELSGWPSHFDLVEPKGTTDSSQDHLSGLGQNSY